MQHQLQWTQKDLEDWKGKTNPAERRKLQNRINQRAHRRRCKTGQKNVARTHASLPRGQHPLLPEIVAGEPSTGTIVLSNEATPSTLPLTPQKLCVAQHPRISTVMQTFAQYAYDRYIHNTPVLTDLPMLVQFNVVKALAHNAQLLGVAKDWTFYDAISPFNKQGPDLGPLTQNASNRQWPNSLLPTSLQLSVEHHPWIDLFPLPRMRDNFLRAIERPEVCDEDDLCYDLCQYGEPDGKATLIIWSEPWNPRSWEASTAFLKKWGWLLHGCPEILEATNYWRGKRGEQLLSLADVATVMKQSLPVLLDAER